MDAAREVGCIACIVSGRITAYSVPSEYTAIHHIEGKTAPRCHYKTIPLCPSHHQTGEIRIHGTRREFEKAFGTEEELLDTVKRIIKSFGVLA